MEQTPVFDTETGRLGSDLDRLETKVGKIGLNGPEIARSILADMDSVYERIQAMENETSRKQAVAQFDGIAGRLRQDTSAFLRDLGGSGVMKKAREAERPSEDHWWWYLDVFLAQNRKGLLRRLLIILGVIAAALVVLALVYNRFFAPDPQFAARYAHEQSARDALINGDLDLSLNEISAGLAAAPNDPTLLALRGVVEEKQGKQEAAIEDFMASQAGFGSKETFLLARGQAYAMASMPTQALADALTVIQMNPNSSEAYLLAGQVHEASQEYREALDFYNKGFDAANATGHTELAAMARMRIAMVMQTMGGRSLPADGTETPTP